MTTPDQPDFFTPELEKKFQVWADTPGGRQVLRIAYAITAKYAARYLRTGRRVSIRLIWETMRHHIVHIRTQLKAKGIRLHKVEGFALNDHFHAYVARHIMEHRKDWNGLFELREVGKSKT